MEVFMAKYGLISIPKLSEPLKWHTYLPAAQQQQQQTTVLRDDFSNASNVFEMISAFAYI